MQNAFSSAPLRASLRAIAAGEPVAGMALGIVVFGDRVQMPAGLRPDVRPDLPGVKSRSAGCDH